MNWKASDESEKRQTGRLSKRAQTRRFADRTDYEQRDFVNLAAIAFVLALALGIAWTIKALDHQISLEKCLDSGRKECRQITDAGIRSYVKLNR